MESSVSGHLIGGNNKLNGKYRIEIEHLDRRFFVQELNSLLARCTNSLLSHKGRIILIAVKTLIR